MRNVSQEYIDAIRARTRVDRLQGTITLLGGTKIPLNESNLQKSSVKISKQCITGEELEFGNAILSQLELSIVTDQSRYVFYGAEVSLVYSIRTNNKQHPWYDLPLGIFTIVEAEKKKSVLKLTAYDNLQKLDKSYDGAELTGTPFELLTQIAAICNITFVQSEAEIQAFPNGTSIVIINDQSECATYRDCVKLVLQVLAAFAVADFLGNLVVRSFNPVPVATLTSAHRFVLSVADYVVQYSSLVVTTTSGYPYSDYYAQFESGLELKMESAAWNSGEFTELNDRVSNILDKLVQLVYTPCSLDMLGDPSLECGDMLLLDISGQLIPTLITELTWTFRGRTSVLSAGKNPYLSAANTRQQRINTRVNQSLNQNAATANEALQLAFNTAIAFNTQTSADILAKLTDNYTIQGLYVQDNKFYFNAQTGKIINLIADDITAGSLKSKDGITTVFNLDTGELYTGKLRVDGGSLGGWNIEKNAIYSNVDFASSTVFLCSSEIGCEFEFTIGGRTASGWMLKAGKFGVHSDGNIYGDDVHLTGSFFSASSDGSGVSLSSNGIVLINSEGRTLLRINNRSDGLLLKVAGTGSDSTDFIGFGALEHPLFFAPDADNGGNLGAPVCWKTINGVRILVAYDPSSDPIPTKIE